MALVVKDRVKVTSTTTGTGTLTLGSAVAGYQSFSVIGNGNETFYTIVGGTQWEVGVGTYTSSGTTLSRDTVLESSTGGAKIDFSVGVKEVFVTYPAEKAVYFGNLPTVLLVNDRSGSPVSVALANGFLPVTNRAGGTVNVPVS
jgi:hypothetical protein